MPTFAHDIVVLGSQQFDLETGWVNDVMASKRAHPLRDEPFRLTQRLARGLSRSALGFGSAVNGRP